jgi:anaerobic magnesium-protoporphyrin IX monomethyl ester cyclase
MKIVLADPPLARLDSEREYSSPNLGILYLISALRQNIDGVRIYYIEAFDDLASHLKKVEEIQPDLYGISFGSTFAALSYRTIRAVKEQHPLLPIICGGVHPTARPDDVLKNTGADVCCLGEGEETIVELVRSYLSGGDLSTVAGIAYRNNGGVLKTTLRAPIVDLDSIPFPAWDMIDLTKYSGFQRNRGGLSTATVPSRGCPFNCTFCSNPVWKLQKPWVRVRSPQNIAEEVEYLYNRGIREIYLRADEMNPDIEWCLATFVALKQLGHPDLYFQCNLRAKPVTDELATALREANCWLIHLGIESGNQRVLDGVGKKITLDEIVAACRTLKKHDIEVRGFLMMYQVWEEAGKLCVETPKEVDRSMSFMRRLRSQRLIDYITWVYAIPYPGSELCNVAEKHGLIKPGVWGEKSKSIFLDIPMNLPGISSKRMLLSRAQGIMLQGQLALTAGGFFKKENLWANMKRSATKLKYMLRPW